MKQAVIDIGSNSIRLTLYETDGTEFRILFREKIMAGLAGYVEEGALTADGIACACKALIEFGQILRALKITRTAVFATASLRNIRNTKEALAVIEAETHYSIEVIGGEEEALLGYTGAMRELKLCDGVFLDIGGASTELVLFENGEVRNSHSFPVGSLNLYRRCVKKILPGAGSLRRIEKMIKEEMDDTNLLPAERHSPLVCVGGTARAVQSIAGKYFGLPENCRSVTAEQLEELCGVLLFDRKQATELILKNEPDRIHTLLPGLLILQHVFQHFEATEMFVSRYGVREGFLCQRLLTKDTDTRKTGN